MNGPIERYIRRWRIQRFRSQWLDGSARFGAAAAAYLLCMLILDRCMGLSQNARLVFFWAGALGAAGGLYVHYVRPLKSLAIARLLKDVSARYPHIRAFVMTAWELKQGPPSGNTSKELAQEHVRRTEELLKELPPGSVFPARPSRPAAKRTVMAAAAWGVAMPWLYSGPSNFQRVLAPWRDAQLDALVEVVPGNKDVLWAQPVDISSRWRVPHANGPLLLETRADGGKWGLSAWDGEEGDRSFSRISSLTSILEYRIRYKNLYTQVYRLEPIPYPRMLEVLVSVRQPGKGAQRRTLSLGGEGEIAALRRSWVTLRGRADRPVSRARLSVSYLNIAVDMKQLPSGEWEGGFPLGEDGTLNIELISREGSRDPRPVSYALRALDDDKPEVELLSPAFELDISRREKLTVTYEAKDDYGLTSLSFLYKVNDGAEKVLPLHVFKRPTERYLGDFDWDLSRFPAGAKIAFRLRARDNARPNPQTDVSHEGVIHIVDFESVHAEAQQSWRGTEDALRRLASDEGEMQKLLEALARDQAKAQSDPAAHARMEENLRELSRKDADLAQAWSETVREVKNFARSMNQDSYANPGMTQTAEMLSQWMELMRSSELPKAQQAAKEKRFEAAAKQHERMAQATRKASEMLTNGREMQSMQDFWGEAHRMDQAGGEISDALDQIAKSGKAPNAQERAELDEALAKLRKQMDDLVKTMDAMPKVDPNSDAAQTRKVYRVPLKDAQRTANALQGALERGDYALAAQIAKQLARQLEQVRKAVAKAAQDSAQGSQESVSKRMEAAERMWKDVVEQQSKSLQMVEGLEDSKLKQKAEAQKNLLQELAALQKEIVDEARTLPALVPLAALNAMEKILAEFEARQVREAPVLLKGLVDSLAFRSQRFPHQGEVSIAHADVLMGLSNREKKILEKLKEGAAPPQLTEQQFSDSMAASAVQKQARRKTESLDKYLNELAQGAQGVLAPEVQESLTQAQAEQAKAEGALEARDSATSRVHQRRALDHLEKGQKGMQQALKQQMSIAQQSTQPFGQPRGMARPSQRRGSSGANQGFVPLPGAEDYQPPREIRREIQKSLQEKRPKIFDETTDEYLRRMSE